MRDAENETHEGKRKAESLWPIMRISHTRSRYIYELYYKRDAISKELYDWLLKEGYADAKSVTLVLNILHVSLATIALLPSGRRQAMRSYVAYVAFRQRYTSHSQPYTIC
jgi:hypothetical protein